MLGVDVHVGGALDLPLTEGRVEDAVRAVLRAEDVAQAEISVALVSDDEISGMNREHLRHEGVTDVISFPLSAAGGPVVGDVYIGAEQALRQASELGIAPEEELLRLVIHGTLHVLGYDHPEGREREDSEMYRRQEELLRLVVGRGPA